MGLISLYKKVGDLVTLLNKAKRLHRLAIRFVDREDLSCSWIDHQGRNVETTLDRGVRMLFGADWEMIFRQFCHLQNASKVWNELPRAYDWATRKLNTGIATMAYREIDWPCLGAHIPVSSEQHIDLFHLRFENILDEVPGREAAMKRLERFISWYADDGTARYMCDWERICASQDPEMKYHKERFLNRHDSMLEFNPLSSKMQQIRLQLGIPREFREDLYVLETTFLKETIMDYAERLAEYMNHHPHHSAEDDAAWQEISSTWNRAAWRAFHPEGIPKIKSVVFPYTENFQEFMEADEPVAPCCCAECGMPGHCPDCGRWEDEGVRRILCQMDMLNFASGELTRKVFEQLPRVPASKGAMERLSEMRQLVMDPLEQVGERDLGTKKQLKRRDHVGSSSYCHMEIGY